MSSKRGKRTQGRLLVKVTHVSVPGAEARLAKAIDLLLKAVAMNTTTSQIITDSGKEESSRQGIVQDTPTNGESKPLDAPKS